jgi:ubiquinone/menaquinone biosynthesis C-methylase UbiE
MNRRHFLSQAGALTAATVGVPALAQSLADSPLTLAQAATRTPDVIYVPTPQEVVDTMLSLAKPTKNDLVYDLGCGDGRIVVTAAKKYGARGIGVDIDPNRIAEANANVRAENVGDRVRIVQGDLFEFDFKDATIVTLYLLPSLNLKLRPKLWRELKPGTRVVSHDFDMGDWVPEQKVNVASRTVYFWRITGKMG